MLLSFLLISLFYFSKAEENTQLLCDLDTGEWCGEHQLCSPREGTKGKRVGICLCAVGYHRLNNSKECYLDNEVIAHTKPTENNKLEILINGPSTVQLPEEEIEITAKILNPTGSYSFHWELIGGTGRADVDSYNDATLKITNLQEGQLVYRVNVRNETHDGFRDFNLTIFPMKKPNSPPVAVIRPESPVNGVEGSQIVLDAEGSTDDDRIVSYNWYQDQGPSVTLPAMNTAVLKLDTLVPGEYNFSVVVQDVEGLESKAYVTVRISAERDDPPKAAIYLCGTTKTGSISVRLPQEMLLLCGNASTDDKGIASYNWYRIDSLSGKLAVDMSGSSTNVLTLTNIQENEQYGPYEFQLDVKDTKGQNDSARITIFVNKAANLAPEVDAGNNQTVILPQTTLILNGNVKDDGSIVTNSWEQIGGPNQAVFSNGNQPRATVSGLIEGLYSFKLNAVDDGGLNSSSITYVSVERGKNEPPVARARNVTVYLPHSIAVLNASESTDDAGIISYKWTPFDDVPAIMTALDGSEDRAVMYLTGLVKGVFSYTLTVADQQKATNSVVVALTVEQGSEDLESVELVLTLSPQDASYRFRAKLEARIASILASSIKEISSASVKITTIDKIPLDGRLRIVFFAIAPDLIGNRMRRKVSLLPGGVISAETIVDILRSDENMHEDFSIVSIQPLYCKLGCSNHGYCSNITKECVCDNFWMTSLLTLLLSGWRHNDCAWSSLYFWLLLLAGLIFAGICCIRRRFMFSSVSRRRFTRRRAKYSSLKSDSEEDIEIQRLRRAPRLKPLPLPPSSDTLESEDDLLVRNSWTREEDKNEENRLKVP